VLVIDDMPQDVQLFVTDVLGAYGYQAVTTVDGAEGLRLALSEPLDLAIVGLKSLCLTGTAAVEALTEKRPNLPVVLVMARGSEREIV